MQKIWNEIGWILTKLVGIRSVAKGVGFRVKFSPSFIFMKFTLNIIEIFENRTKKSKPAPKIFPGYAPSWNGMITK